MPDTGAPWNIPYVAGTDLVSDWPTDSQTLAEAIADGLDVAGLGIGSNIVQAVKTDTFTTTSATFVDITGLSATITPSATSSKVLIIAGIATSITAGSPGFLRLTGGNSSAFVGDTAGSRTLCIQAVYDTDDNGFALEGFPLIYLDSPATTSATTYKVQGAVTGSRTLGINHRPAADADASTTPRGASSLIVVEVAG